MASGSDPQQTHPFAVRLPRPSRRASPYPPNPSTQARNSPIRPGSSSAKGASEAIPFAGTSTCTALPSELTKLETALRTLKTSLGGLPPVKSAIDGLEGCVAHMQIGEQTRHEYEDIVPYLTNLTCLIQAHVAEKKPSYVPGSIANAARAIEDQTRAIRGCRDAEAALEYYHRIRELFQKLQADISSSIWDVSQEHQIDLRLKNLHSVSDAYHNAASSSSATKRTGCTEGTRVELLETAQTWIQDEAAARIYWLNGMAGTGKTTIAYSVCEMLLKRHQLGGSFFCSRNSPDCRDVNRIIPTIAYQLARYSNPYRRTLCDILMNDPDVAKRNIGTQFKELISGPLTGIGKAMPTDVVVVIDALDECTAANGTQDILNMLLRHASDLPIKFFISSRPEPEISEYMVAREGAMRSIIWLHDIEKSLVQADIKIYLTEALAHVHLSSSQIEQLAEHAGCLFIFAATAVRYILPAKGAVSQRQRLQVILGLEPNQSNKSHQDIDNLYHTILSGALDDNIYEDAELTARQQVLWTVICAREPLTMSTLGEVLDIPDQLAIQLTLQPLQSVLHVPEDRNVISSLHASFPDFLLNEKRAGNLYCNEDSHNLYLADRCFQLMARSLRFNICSLESSYLYDEDIRNLQLRVDKAISTGLFYSCRYWGDHLTRHLPTTRSLLLLESFLQSHLLSWMEVLNLKGQINHGESVLSQALAWLQSQDNCSELKGFTYDARNFLTTFAGNPTSLSTPHIYISVLPFTSKRSRVHETYLPRMRGLIHVDGVATDTRRKSPLATWAVRSGVSSLSLSNNGKRLVFGSRDNDVSVLDIPSGSRILGPLKGHQDWVCSVTYSPDNTLIASCSEDSTIRIWDSHTGSPIADPLLGHTAAVPSIAFSPDGARLASGSDDRTIRIWDARLGTQVGQPLQGGQGCVKTIAFSPDGQHLASGSNDSKIRVWDWQKNMMGREPLEGHRDTVLSIAYSSNGHYLASGSADKTVRVWDTLNGTLLAGPFIDHNHPVLSVSFSPNGTRVVSGSSDGTIRLWEAWSGGARAGSFGRQGAGINSVLFTADGTRILSGSNNGLIRVWDARHEIAGATESTGHTGSIYSIALSPDGKRVASGSDDYAICVWDTHSGALVAGPFTGHTGEVRSVAFSPDGARIVSGSNDRTLRIWDASTGAVLVGPIEGHTNWVLSVAFSPDGSQSASGSSDATIRLWDSHTGASIAEPFEGHTYSVMSIAFSPVAARIVSGSYDDTVRMWDASEGTTLWKSDTHTGVANCVAFSPDGTRVVSGSSDILVLDARDGAVLHGPFTGHIWAVTSVAFSPDGTCVVSGSYDQTVRVWDVESGTTVAGPLKGHQSSVTSAAFSPGGARIISGSWDKTIRVWDLAAVAQASPPDDWAIDGDGWLIDSRSQRLFWVPSDLRDPIGFLTACSPIAMNASWTTRTDLSTLLLGDRWHECYDRSLAAASS